MSAQIQEKLRKWLAKHPRIEGGSVDLPSIRRCMLQA